MILGSIIVGNTSRDAACHFIDVAFKFLFLYERHSSFLKKNWSKNSPRKKERKSHVKNSVIHEINRKEMLFSCNLP